VARHSRQRPIPVRWLTLGAATLLALGGCGSADAPDPQQAAVTNGHDPEVECEAEYVVHEDEVHVVYFLEPAAPLECTVTGLAEDVEASWGAEMYDEDMADTDETVDEQGGALTVVNGEATFTTLIPDEPPLLWMVAWVRQGDVDVYHFGRTEWYWEGPMECTPEPVTEGETVECIAENMRPDEPFFWAVMFYDQTGGTVTEFGGEGTTDENGFGAFTFEVPPGEGAVTYSASADQKYDFAAFDGTIR
jgi:hypothetical protein